MVFNVPFEDIGKEQIDELVDNAVKEDRHLEFKRELPGNSDGERKEFAADISAFANEDGGDILYGVEEDGDNAPKEAMGVDEDGKDQAQRLEQMIRHNITPRLSPAARIRAIEGFGRGPVFLARIPNSWMGPHMVSVKDSRFYRRDSIGKHPMDIDQIRRDFLGSDRFEKEAYAFRDNRLALLRSGQTPAPIRDNAISALHVVPYSAIVGHEKYSVPELYAARVSSDRRVHWDGRERPNFEGVVSIDLARGEPACDSYTQMFRNGALERISTDGFDERRDERDIGSTRLEMDLIEVCGCCVNFLHNLGAETPLALFISLIGIKGFTFHGPRDSRGPGYVFERENYLFPPILIESYEGRTSHLLRPVFDQIWQSVGAHNCEHYDSEGNWSQ